MNLFIDEAANIEFSYDDLLAQLNNKKELNKYIYSTNIKEVIIDFISSLYYGYDVILLDGDFTLKELENLKVAQEDLIYKNIIEAHNNISNIDELIEKILEKSNDIKVSIFTSGTTGMPKKFEHSLAALLRNIKISEKHKNDIWGFAYNITHFAGIQVFLQAFVNKNTIVNLFNKNSNNADVLLRKYKCNSISATPTFYRNFIFISNEKNLNLKFVTFGGEKFDNDLLLKAKNKFPNAKIRNIYASTEVGSLLSGINDSFAIPPNLEKFIKISENNHLMIHRSLLQEKNVNDEWYDTNDIVSINKNGTFKILSRESDFINVGGYKVNPLEVESLILKVQGVLDVCITARENSVIGNILVANIRKDKNYSEDELKKSILEILKNELQYFKIPRLFKFVDKIERNRTGKKVRI